MKSWVMVTGLVVAGATVLTACSDDETNQATGGHGGSGASGGAGGTGGSANGGSGGDGGTGGAAPESVSISFAAKVNGADFACGTTYDDVGTSNASGTLSDFRFYVHDVALLSSGDPVPVELEQDGVWQYENLALLDFEDKSGPCANGTTELNVTVRGTVPAGQSYDGLTFKLGVPFDLNHADAATAPSPLNLTGLFWNWQGGYKFFRADFSASGSLGPFNLHLGSTGCDGDPTTGGTTLCDRPNITEVTFAAFDVAQDVVAVDYGAVVATSDVSTDTGGAPGCMSGPTDPECPAVFTNLGIDIATGDLHPEQQALFSVEE